MAGLTRPAFRWRGYREGRDSSEIQRGRGSLRVRQYVQDALDQAGAASRNLLGLPSVLHGAPEADRYRRTRRALHEEIRRPDSRTAEDGCIGRQSGKGDRYQGQEEDDHQGEGGRDRLSRWFQIARLPCLPARTISVR